MVEPLRNWDQSKEYDKGKNDGQAGVDFHAFSMMCNDQMMVLLFFKLHTVKSRAVDRSTIQRSKVKGQRSQYIRIKFPLDKESENPRACY